MSINCSAAGLDPDSLCHFSFFHNMSGLGGKVLPILEPKINVFPKCFIWMKPLFVAGDTPTITTWFLTSDDQRQRNSDALN